MFWVLTSKHDMRGKPVGVFEEAKSTSNWASEMRGVTSWLAVGRERYCFSWMYFVVAKFYYTDCTRHYSLWSSYLATGAHMAIVTCTKSADSTMTLNAVLPCLLVFMVMLNLTESRWVYDRWFMKSIPKRQPLMTLLSLSSKLTFLF